MKLTKTNELESLLDCLPTINFAVEDNKENIYKLEREIAGWHHRHNVYATLSEVKKMKEFLGDTTFEGDSIPDLEVEFFYKQYIWTYTSDDIEDSYIAIYLNEEGLSVEVNDECEDFVVDILQEVLNMIH